MEKNNLANNETNGNYSKENFRIEALKISYEALKGKIFGQYKESVSYSDLQDIFFLADCNAKFIFGENSDLLNTFNKKLNRKQTENEILRRQLDEINNRT